MLLGKFWFDWTVDKVNSPEEKCRREKHPRREFSSLVLFIYIIFVGVSVLPYTVKNFFRGTFCIVLTILRAFETTFRQMDLPTLPLKTLNFNWTNLSKQFPILEKFITWGLQIFSLYCQCHLWITHGNIEDDKKHDYAMNQITSLRFWVFWWETALHLRMMGA